MSHISQFTTKFRVRKPTNTNNTNTPDKPTIKRPRLVCTQCQKSKLRCDRASPCGNCAKRVGECTYPVHQRPHPPHQGAGPSSRSSGSNGVAEDRLMHLESMVKLLMESQGKDVGAVEVPVVDVESSVIVGRVDQPPRIEKDTTTYAGSTHWSAILDDIQELKSALGGYPQIEEEQDRQPESAHPTISTSNLSSSQNEIIFGSPNHHTLQQIITQHLPSKIQIDQLLAIYFKGETYIAPFIHSGQFHRQYQEFWANPSPTAVNPLWLSMLFSLCCMGTLVGITAVSPKSTTDNEFHSLHTGAAKCLVLGRYHLPQKFSLTALALYCHCKNLRTLDPSREVGAIVSMVVRMAYEMGYHRDPDHFGTFSIFEGEMRRRFWASCRQMDLMISFQLGLPSNICIEDCDTRPPLHLLDSDFTESCTALPPPRPLTEQTNLLWFIIKEKQMISFAKVCRDALSFTPQTPSQIQSLDREIREMQSSIPSILRATPLSESTSDPPFLIMTRLYVDFVSLKSLCVLHRKYMALGSAWSTQACIDAGTTLVGKFIDMYNAFKPGGQLAGDRWMLTNFTVNDFLMGTTLLCLILHTKWKKTLPDGIIDATTEKEVSRLLEQAYVICTEKEGESKDVRRVARAVLCTLTGVKIQQVAEEDVNSLAPPVDHHLQEANLLLPPWYGYLQGGEDSFGLLDPYNFDLGGEDLDWGLFNT